MELGRFRDLTRIYALIMGAFSIVFFVQGVMLGYFAGGAAGAFLCSASLFVVLVFGVLVLWFGLEKWDRFYTDMTVPPPYYPYPFYPPTYYYWPQGYYYPVPAYSPPSGHYYPQAQYFPPPATTQPPAAPPSPPPDPGQQGHQPPAPGYRVPSQYQQAYQPPPPAYQALAPPAYQAPAQPAHGPAYQYYQPPAQPYQAPPPAYWYPPPAYPAPPQPAGREVDPRRPLIVPHANRLLAVFLGSVLVGGLSLALAPLTGGLTLLLFLPAFIIGFSFPSLIWISYVYGFEKRHNLPSRAVLTALVYGMLSTIPALIVNTAAGRYFGEGAGASLATMLVTAAVIAPLVEEFSKPWGLYLVRGEVRGPLDGLIMGVTCGVGFALIENITYELSFVFTGESAAAVWTLGSLARGLGSIMVHATGAGMIGYAYGRYRTGGGAMLIPLAYLAGVALHSLWNGSSAVFDTVSWGTAATVGFMFVFAVGAFLLLDRLIRMGTAFEDASRPPGLPPR